MLPGPIGDWLVAAFTPAADAESAELRALEPLRADPGATVRTLNVAWSQADERDYGLRWALVHLGSRLESAEAVPFLTEVLRTPIPRERSGDVHQSTVGEEVTMRMEAVSGLRTLAASGERQAADALLEALEHESFAVRSIAYVELRELPSDLGLDGAIEERLREEDRDTMTTLRRVSISEIEPPAADSSGGDLDPPPLGDEPPRARRSTAPKIEGS